MYLLCYYIMLLVPKSFSKLDDNNMLICKTITQHNQNSHDLIYISMIIAVYFED